MLSTCWEAWWSTAFSGGPARKCGRAIPCVLPTGWKSAGCSGTSWIWSGFSSFRCYICSRIFMDDKHAHDVKKHLKVYIGVFVAVLKAGLVAGFFMHLVSEKKPIYTILVFTAFFFVGLMALTIWSMNDSPEMTATIHHTPPAHAAPAHHVP